MPVTARVPMCDFVILDAAGDLADRDGIAASDSLTGSVMFREMPATTRTGRSSQTGAPRSGGTAHGRAT
jgi:hypothetical protein